MKIENQVCTLEQAKKLYDLLIDGEAAFYWAYPTMNSGWRVYPSGCFSTDDGSEYYPAYTVSELQIMDGTLGNIDISIISHLKGKFYSDVDPASKSYENKFEYYDTFAQAFAAKVIRALKSDYYTAAEANERLATN